MKTPLLSFLLIILCTVAYSQNPGSGTVRGFVFDKESGEPILFTNVVIQGTTLGASTDINGFFTMAKVKPGNYTLQTTYLGYDTVYQKVNVRPNGIVNVKLYLSEKTINLGVINISAEKIEKKTRVQVSVTKVTAREISQIPSIGGDADIAQYMQVIPGVVFTGDQGGQLYIRGGSPIQNKVVLDGMVIYNPFHSIGLFSVFDTDIIRNVDVLTGGFNAEHGGRISAVMDITTKDGSSKRTTGKVSASPFLVKGLLEGPLGKKTTASSGATFVVSAKASYLEQSSALLYTYSAPDGKLPYNFLDFYGKTSIKSESGSKLNLFGFSFTDRVNFSDVKIGWDSYGIGTDFVLIPAASSTLIKGSIAFSDYRIKQTESDGLPRTSGINGFNVGMNFNYFLGDKDEINYGFEILGFRTEFAFTNSSRAIVEQNQNTTELAGYLKYRKVANKLIIEPGVRMQYYASLSNFSFEPRLGMKYNITDYLRVKFAAGIYSQNLISAVSDRDVVNLFYGFLSGPDNLQQEFDGQPVKHKLQKATHGILGFEIDLAKNLEMNLEGYVKEFTQLTNINRNKLFPESAIDKPEELRRDFIIERGRANGIDLSLRYRENRVYLWGTYSIAMVNRFDGNRTYFPHFDRRHNVNLLATYKSGEDRSWEFSARWNFGTGFPFTPTRGFFEKIQFNDGVNTDYTNQNGELGVIYGDLNSSRLPTYHRLDVSAKKRWEIGDFSALEANFSLSNVYNRDNLFYFDRINFDRVNQLPILPSFSLAYYF